MAVGQVLKRPVHPAAPVPLISPAGWWGGGTTHLMCLITWQFTDCVCLMFNEFYSDEVNSSPPQFVAHIKGSKKCRCSWCLVQQALRLSASSSVWVCVIACLKSLWVRTNMAAECGSKMTLSGPRGAQVGCLFTFSVMFCCAHTFGTACLSLT